MEAGNREALKDLLITLRVNSLRLLVNICMYEAVKAGWRTVAEIPVSRTRSPNTQKKLRIWIWPT